MHAGRAAVALARACHPLPTAAVTGFAVAYAVAAAAQPARTFLLVGAAVLTGQVSVGWSNDALDAAADRAAGRTDKPTVVGTATPRTLWTAAAVAVLVCVPLSLALGNGPGVLHLVAVVGSGWAYNLGLKRTAASALPYVVAFGLLPAVAALPSPASAWPHPTVLGASALLGTAAHFANVVADIPGDLAAGVRGLPQRLGARGSLVATAALVAAASGVLVAGPARPGAPGLVLLLGGCVVALGALRVEASRAFPVALGGIALVVAAVLLA